MRNMDVKRNNSNQTASKEDLKYAIKYSILYIFSISEYVQIQVVS
jgi:hypothetical protein